MILKFSDLIFIEGIFMQGDSLAVTSSLSML